MMYIDGEHTYDAVREELELYAPLLSPGGLLTFDDYSVDTTSCFPPSAVCNVCQARVAHLTLAGNSETPENTVNFPSPD